MWDNIATRNIKNQRFYKVQVGIVKKQTRYEILFNYHWARHKIIFSCYYNFLTYKSLFQLTLCRAGKSTFVIECYMAITIKCSEGLANNSF